MSKCVKCGNEILTGDIHWEMGLCNNCYNELYKDHKTHISLDKMWLKLAQDFRDENEKLQDKVADLEAKLAESEKKAYSRGHSQRDIANEIKLNALREDVANKEKRIVELKQQLAESETQLKEEIEEKNGVRRALSACNRQNDEFADMIKKLENEKEELKQQLADKDKEIEYQESMKILAVENQNKNAIEQLEQIINLFEPYENEEKDTILCANNGISFLEYIDQQISLLKGKVEDD